MRSALPIAVAALVALASCGLEIQPVLDPPLFTELTPIGQTSTLTNVPTVVSEFRGYELYYRFYSRDEEKVETLSSFEQLAPAGFRRVCSDEIPVGAQVPPVILVDPADRNLDRTTELVFQDADTAAYADYQGTVPRTVKLRRAVEEGGQVEEFRRGAFDADDEDLAAIWSAVQAQGSELHLALYVMSNGLNGWSPTLYSEIRYIGSMIYHL